MMQIRHMRVIVNERDMPVHMRVRLDDGSWNVMLVLVVRVVHVEVVVLELVVRMRVAVAFTQEEHDASGHEEGRDDMESLDRVAEKGYGRQCTDEGCGGEECRLPRCAEEAQCIDVEHDAQSVREDSDE
jgi:hypothetical protein